MEPGDVTKDVRKDEWGRVVMSVFATKARGSETCMRAQIEKGLDIFKNLLTKKKK